MSVIKVDNIHKKFKIYYDKGQSFKEKILFKNRNRYEERWVLKGISFEVDKGEAIGLIGENGCGKSTLLKLMSKIMYPDEGTIEINGRVSSLIELGAGFHPDMSGRENIYTNAAIFGLTKKEIDERLESIIEFSELEEFIDNPVRTYSSGMYMRLAFSVAINVDADVLLIDEILAVGDANFQAKCFDKLRELKASGVTIVIVTHDTGTIERFCSKAVWINEGEVRAYGNCLMVVDSYLSYMNEKRIESIAALNEKHHHQEEKVEEQVNGSQTQLEEKQDKVEETLEVADSSEEEKIDYDANRFGLKYIEITKAVMKNQKDKETGVFRAGEDVTVEIHYKVNKPLTEYNFGVGFYTLEKQCVTGINTALDQVRVPHTKNEGCVKFKIHDLNLLTGKYILHVAIVDMNGTPMDFYRDYSHFDVISSDRSIGVISMNHEWEI